MSKLIIILLLLFPTHSYAYLGPGMGGGIIAATLGVVVAIFAAIFGVLWFPIKRFLKSRENKKEKVKK